VRALATVLALPALAMACAHESQSREASSAADAHAEARWLRQEVEGLRASLAERDRREAEMWRAYVDLAQRIGQLQLAREQTRHATPAPAPESAQVQTERTTPECILPRASTETPPKKSVMRAIHQSRMTLREKRQLLESMRPARAIDIVNPWEVED